MKVRKALGTSTVVRLSSCQVVMIDPWDMLNNFCFHVYAQKCQVVRLSSCHVVTLSRCQVVKFDPWDMLNNFCFHVYAQKSLFIAENCNAFFLPQPPPVSLEFLELVPS